MNGIVITFQVLGLAFVLMGGLCLFVCIFAIVSHRLSVARARLVQSNRDRKILNTAERCRRDFA